MTEETRLPHARLNHLGTVARERPPAHAPGDSPRQGTHSGLSHGPSWPIRWRTSRDNHARAYAQSRSTWRDEIARASAASYTVSPAKKRRRTTAATSGSDFSKRSR